MYDEPTLSLNFALLLRTSDRAIILAVVSLFLSRLRAQHGSLYLSLTHLPNVSFHLLSLFRMYPLFHQSRTTFGACAFYPTLFKIYRCPFFQCIYKVKIY